MSRTKLMAVLTSLIALSVMLLPGCKPPEEPQDVPKIAAIPKVQVNKLVPQVYQQTIRTFGVLEAAESVSLSSPR